MANGFRAVIVMTFALTPAAGAIDGKAARPATPRPELVLIAAESESGPPALGCGVLVHPRAVLTAAHVAEKRTRFALTLPHAKPKAISATATVSHLHPEYSRGDPDGDLAVIVLDTPLDIGGPLPTLHDGPLLRLDAGLTVVGRVSDGRPTNAFVEAAVDIVPFPARANVYGGFPRRAQPGDSGGPVYDAARPDVLAGVVSGFQPWSRRQVPVDAYMPLGKKSAKWARGRFPVE